MRIIPSNDCESFTALLGVEDLVSHAILMAEFVTGIRLRSTADVRKELIDQL